MDDLDQVGGKNASLGEMIANLASLGVNVPGGFATTADAFRDFLSDTGLDDRIGRRLEGLDVDDARNDQRGSIPVKRLVQQLAQSIWFQLWNREHGYLYSRHHDLD